MPKPPAPPQIPYRNIGKGTSSTAYVDKLIAFLEGALPDFPKEKRVEKTQSENHLTEELFQFLSRQARRNDQPFVFQPESSEKKINQKGHTKRIDLGAYVETLDIDMEYIYGIEAKKLPTDKAGGAREKEYVIGKSGGIERFKKEDHGLDKKGNLLPRNGMIAYVGENDFSHWFAQINEWVSAEGWATSENLTADYFSEIGKLTSVHTRMSGESVELTHFWVKI